MNWVDSYTFLLTVVGFSVLFLSFVLLRPPRKLSRTMLSIAAALSGVFIILTVIELIINDPHIMIILRNFQQISLVFTPFFLLGYAMELHREAPKKTVRTIAVMAIPSVIDIILIFTDPFHGLMRESVTTTSIWGLTEVSTESKVLNSFLGVYPLVIVVMTIMLLIRNMFDVPKQYRMTHWLSALAMSIPLIIIPITSFLSIKIPGIFALSNCSMALLLILMNKKTDFNAVWPLSRHEVLENLSDGILLIDQAGKIVEANTATFNIMKRMFNISFCQNQIVHKSAYSIFQEITPLIDALKINEDSFFQYEKNGMYFDVNVKMLSKKSNDLRLVVWKDVTDKKEVELQLKELAELDSLTKLTNREAFIANYDQHISRHHSSLVIMDIDNFKQFNDQYGHYVGDKVLKHLAHLLNAHFKGDFTTRLGGEEFGVLTNVANVEYVIARCKAFQTALKKESHDIDPSINHEITISIGICEVTPETPFEEVYKKADQMMYKAKHEGRACIRVW